MYDRHPFAQVADAPGLLKTSWTRRLYSSTLEPCQGTENVRSGVGAVGADRRRSPFLDLRTWRNCAIQIDARFSRMWYPSLYGADCIMNMLDGRPNFTLWHSHRLTVSLHRQKEPCASHSRCGVVSSVHKCRPIDKQGTPCPFDAQISFCRCACAPSLTPRRNAFISHREVT